MVLETCPELSAPNDPLIDIRVGWLPSTSALSASIAFYRPQAELFGGICDGKLVVRYANRLCANQTSGSRQ